jgi:hypothetical protein
MPSSNHDSRRVPEVALPNQCPTGGQRLGTGTDQQELPWSEIERRRREKQEAEQRQKMQDAEAQAAANFDSAVAAYGGSVALSEATGVDTSDIDKMRKGGRQVQYRLVCALLADPKAAAVLLPRENAIAGYEAPVRRPLFTRRQLADAVLQAVEALGMLPVLMPHLQRVLGTTDSDAIVAGLRHGEDVNEAAR